MEKEQRYKEFCEFMERRAGRDPTPEIVLIRRYDPPYVLIEMAHGEEPIVMPVGASAMGTRDACANARARLNGLLDELDRMEMR